MSHAVINLIVYEQLIIHTK